MNDLPVATIRPKGASASTPLGTTGTGAATANNLGTNTAANPVNVDFFYVHPDHLGTPRVVTKPADNKKMWEWQSQPFGETAANENPQNLSGAALTANQFRYNLRFPGQFYDAETSKHYNYFRDYDASIGRYVESDPIGLRGGINTFGYAALAPTKYKDTYGLWIIVVPPIGPPVVVPPIGHPWPPQPPDSGGIPGIGFPEPIRPKLPPGPPWRVDEEGDPSGGGGLCGRYLKNCLKICRANEPCSTNSGDLCRLKCYFVYAACVGLTRLF
jgi:RHS repeat-associated protein